MPSGGTSQQYFVPLRGVSGLLMIGGSLWEQRVSADGAVYFYNPDSHSMYRQSNDTAVPPAYQRVTADGDVGQPQRRLPGALEHLRAGGLFQKWERRIDADGELRTYREFHRKYHTGRIGGRADVAFRWEEARTRSIAWRLRMKSFERRLLKPIGWAVTERLDDADLSSRRETIYYERKTSENGGGIPRRLERFRRQDVAASSMFHDAFCTWDAGRMAFHDGPLERPAMVDLSGIDANRLVENERCVRARASQSPELHKNLLGLMSFDDASPSPPFSLQDATFPLPSSPEARQCNENDDEETRQNEVVMQLEDADGAFIIGEPPRKKSRRRTVPVLDRAAHRLDPQGRWMPVFDVGPEPFNLPRECDGYYALLAPGERHSTPFYKEDRIPRFVPYNGEFICGKCFKSDTDVLCPRRAGTNITVALDAFALLGRQKEVAEHERDMARLELVAAEAEISKLRRERATPLVTPIAAVAPVVAEASVEPQTALTGHGGDARGKKRSQEAKRAGEAVAKVEGGMVLTRSGIEEHGNVLLQAYLKAMGLAIRGGKSDLQARLRTAFDGAGIASWKFGDAASFS